MAKLQKTSVEMEGRYEDRWVLVEDEPPAWEDERELSVAGTRVARLTGPRRVSGAARYVSDVTLPAMLQAVVVRSPHAHATVELDIDAARAVPGVHAVLSAADGGVTQGENPIFTSEPAFAGAPVAALACEDDVSARAALAALAPRYAQLGFVVDPARALAEQRFQEDPVEDESGDVEAGMAAADAIVEAEYSTSAQVQHALEPHCAVAQWLGDELHVHVSTQGIWDARAQLARAFGLDPDRVHVTCEYMGGGFGAKQGPTTEGLIAAYLSRAAAGRAVRVFNDRRSEAVATGHRAQTQQRYRIGATKDGALTAIELTSVIANPMRGWINPTTIPARTLYRCANVRAQAIPLRIDVEPSNAFRAPGIMEGTFGYESALDELAALLEMDPLDLRRANDVDVDQVSGMPYSAKNLSACIDRAAELAGWAGRDALRDREHADGRQRGLGAACQIWWGGGGPPAHALVRMGHDGLVTVVTGAQDIGTGVTTAFAMVAAEELGLPLERVRVEVGSTRYGVFAPVSGGSQTMPSVAPAVRSAAFDLKGKLLELAGDVFEVSPDDLLIVDGEFVSLDGALREPVTEVTGKLGQAQLVGTGSRGPNPDGMRVNTFGCQVAQVAVDVATGEITVERIVAVHDIGRVISPLQARSQVEGGVLQGLGFALMEQRIVDPTTGTVVNANLEDYKLPTHADCPEIVVDFIDKPDPNASSLGLKGLGEPPIVPTAPAIANAVFHATGVRVRSSPITRRRFLEERAR
ncbi:MAG TPA: xanthine dehydrogenase family protein molybdopterin-binding subunit [Gaiellales bacterium]